MQISQGDIYRLTAGQRAAGQFFERVGQIGLKVAEDFMRANDLAQSTAAENTAHDRFLELQTKYQQDQDFSTVEQRWNKDADAIYNDTMRGAKLRPEAKQRLDRWFSIARRGYGADIRRQARTQLIGYGKAEYMKKLDVFLRAGNKEGAEALIKENLATGFLGPEEAETTLQYLDTSIEENEIQQMINLNPEAATELIDKAKYIEPGRKNQLRSQARTATLRKQAEGLEQLEIEREKSRDAISKAIREGQIATDLIEKSLLDETEQWSWFEKQRVDLERRSKGEDSPFRVRGNEEKYADHMARAILDPASLPPKDVREAAGAEDGYTTDDMEKILTELEDKASALKRSEVAFYIDQINAMDIEAWEKSKHTDALREFMRRNPEANVAQLEAFWDKEIEPVVLGFFEQLKYPEKGSWWSWMWKKDWPTEEGALRTKRIERLKEKGLWESLPEAEKQKMLGKPIVEKEISEMTDEELEELIRGS